MRKASQSSGAAQPLEPLTALVIRTSDGGGVCASGTDVDDDKLLQFQNQSRLVLGGEEPVAQPAVLTVTPRVHFVRVCKISQPPANPHTAINASVNPTTPSTAAVSSSESPHTATVPSAIPRAAMQLKLKKYNNSSQLSACTIIVLQTTGVCGCRCVYVCLGV